MRDSYVERRMYSGRCLPVRPRGSCALIAALCVLLFASSAPAQDESEPWRTGPTTSDHDPENAPAVRFPARETLAHLPDVARACAGGYHEPHPERIGHWTIVASLRVRGARVAAHVEARREPTQVRDPVLERCIAIELQRAVRRTMRLASRSATVSDHARGGTHLDVLTPAEVLVQLLAQAGVWHGGGTRQAHLAGCVEDLAGTAPIRLPLLVSGWSGEVWIRWGELTGLSRREIDRMYCIQNVVTYGQLPHGVRDYRFDVDLMRDGSLRGSD